MTAQVAASPSPHEGSYLLNRDLAEMANPVPSNPQIPVTPPPEHETFAKHMFPPHMLPTSVAQQACDTMNTSIQETQSQTQPQTQQSQPQPPSQPQAQTQTQQANPQISGPMPQMYDRDGHPIDPRYIAMASRISAYYQQRCHAISNYQQQRYQQWASMQRQKCQEMMQAAMLVVAWYIRNRIQRRRRRQKRQFRKGLSRVCTAPKTAKGQMVRRWVLDVPSDVAPASDPGREQPPDSDEVGFTMDKETAPDKDAELFRTADNLIKSQINKIDVPLMGIISFDESASESESDSEEEEEYYNYEEEEEMDDYDDDEDQEDEDLHESVDKQAGNKGQGQDQEEEHENTGSQEVQVSAGKGGRKRPRSSMDS